MLWKFALSSIAFLMMPIWAMASLMVGISKEEITPPINSPSAGYARNTNMIGVHDPLWAMALFIDNGEKQIVLCSVDHLGFNYEMVQRVIEEVHLEKSLSNCEIYIASSHTHSGGGGYLDIPELGEYLAGSYDPNLSELYVRQTAKAIIEASKSLNPAKIGIGYGKAEDISQYRGTWPVGATPLSDVTVIKVTKMDDSPLAVLFNYSVHPTVLTGENLLFSADFVGYARDYISEENGQTIYFNGAQGDIIPYINSQEEQCSVISKTLSQIVQNIFTSLKENGQATIDEAQEYIHCDALGKSLAETVQKILHSISTKESLHIKTDKHVYSFKPQPTPFGLTLPIEEYQSEINLLVFDHVHAFVTIPGELSCFYDQRLKKLGETLGYQQVSIFGLVNDAHGYMIPPKAFNTSSTEAHFSFGGEHYAELVEQKVSALLEANKAL
ncbi:Neutral/alkaline non-lysosomal ceramidase [Candidatus Rhabdochlamydia oedothoracis]|uniref:Neutral ceramidase n=1 Tax=Candidatus Rhabdochlamydia oedothoracis TaxID=2720720 RepID=A0ABX8V039_9BACT|nr:MULTISPECIES: neutral/alkaline non-lysosomal ceramidase N-terminal domain-containing protein [Rhabdochlamydia]KAG6559662.1 hypothetical protein RHOW815_000332 [Candidatus Rhabdochlamydia sp. W815]MCL6755568.1 neutral/alkaline non-lysosomal ceramidase N-terminal domain-containing protein [Candidatus Rhabdochlamydia oedothoracis]QYF48544.1 Neutral/alkaline non-lysosomal ceramidase [Candidatus Rhabdochlamydia oedothoracis]